MVITSQQAIEPCNLYVQDSFYSITDMASKAERRLRALKSNLAASVGLI